MAWTTDNIPDQRGQTVIVTGGNSGIGYEAALALARKGANVILACRSMERGNAARGTILNAVSGAQVHVYPLDLASLASVRQFASNFLRKYERLDILINNAGMMAIPFNKTVDGFEMQFGINHLGHFALTGLLLPLILKTKNSRVVTVSSFLHTSGKIDLASVRGSDHYSPRAAYGQSKLANLLFAYELQRRLTASGSTTLSMACHPGWAATNLQAAGPRMSGSKIGERFSAIANRIAAQPAAMGALPTLYAAMAPELKGGEYVGPTGMLGMRGYPAVVKSNALSHDEALARTLWEESEKMADVKYNFAATV